MKYTTLLNDTGRIAATAEGCSLGENSFPFDYPEDFDLGQQHHYRIVDGELIYDPLPETVSAQDPIQQRLEEIESGLCELAEMIVGGAK